jgi:hypothetical protein
VAFEEFYQPVNAELGITANEQMHVIGHDLKLDEVLSPAFNLFGKDRLSRSSIGGTSTLRRYFGQKTTGYRQT